MCFSFFFYFFLKDPKYFNLSVLPTLAVTIRSNHLFYLLSSKFVFDIFRFLPNGHLSTLINLATFLSRVFFKSLVHSSITLIRTVMSRVEFEKRKKNDSFFNYN